MIASDWRSEWKRCTTVSSYIPALISFSATCRRTGASLLGQPHLPHAAFAQLTDQLKSLRKELARGQTRDAEPVGPSPRPRQRRFEKSRR